MTWTLFRQTLYQRRTALLWYSVGLATYSVFISWYFPFMQKVDIQQYIEAFPKEIVALFAGSTVSLNSFGGYIATEYLGLIWVLIVAAAVITFAAKSLSSEVAAGTMELVLAQPVPRRGLVLSRWLAMVVYSAVLVAMTSVPLYLTALWKDVQVDAGNLAIFSAIALLFVLAVGGAAYALAAFSSDSAKPAGIVAGVLVAMWMLQFLASITKWAEKLNPVNLFHYWTTAEMIDRGVVQAGAWWLYGAIAALGLVVAVVGFSRRDVG